jgi:hypothetical protein
VGKPGPPSKVTFVSAAVRLAATNSVAMVRLSFIVMFNTSLPTLPI